MRGTDTQEDNMSEEKKFPAADVSIEDIRSWWKVPAIAHFCSLFRTTFSLPDYEIEDLEEALFLDAGHESTPFLTHLLVALLRGCFGKKDITSDTYHKYLRQFMKRHWELKEGRVNPLNHEDATFKSLPTLTKVDILHSLCDFRLDADDVSVLKEYIGDQLRVEPLGVDSKGAKYWYFYSTRLYKEDRVPTQEEKEAKRKQREKEKNKKRKEKEAARKKKLEELAKAKLAKQKLTEKKGTKKSKRSIKSDNDTCSDDNLPLNQLMKKTVPVPEKNAKVQGKGRGKRKSDVKEEEKEEINENGKRKKKMPAKKNAKKMKVDVPVKMEKEGSEADSESEEEVVTTPKKKKMEKRSPKKIKKEESDSESEGEDEKGKKTGNKKFQKGRGKRKKAIEASSQESQEEDNEVAKVKKKKKVRIKQGKTRSGKKIKEEETASSMESEASEPAPKTGKSKGKGKKASCTKGKGKERASVRGKKSGKKKRGEESQGDTTVEETEEEAKPDKPSGNKGKKGKGRKQKDATSQSEVSDHDGDGRGGRKKDTGKKKSGKGKLKKQASLDTQSESEVDGSKTKKGKDRKKAKKETSTCNDSQEEEGESAKGKKKGARAGKKKDVTSQGENDGQGVGKPRKGRRRKREIKSKEFISQSESDDEDEKTVLPKCKPVSVQIRKGLKQPLEELKKEQKSEDGKGKAVKAMGRGSAKKLKKESSIESQTEEEVQVDAKSKAKKGVRGKGKKKKDVLSQSEDETDVKSSKKGGKKAPAAKAADKKTTKKAAKASSQESEEEPEDLKEFKTILLESVVTTETEDTTSESDEEPESSRWHLICHTEEDWHNLAESFRKSKVACEKELYLVLTEDFLPEIHNIFAAKERALRRKLQEMVPRRTSGRIADLKVKQEEEARLNAIAEFEEAQKVEAARNISLRRRNRRQGEYAENLDEEEMEEEEEEENDDEEKMKEEERLKRDAELERQKEERAMRAKLREAKNLTDCEEGSDKSNGMVPYDLGFGRTTRSSRSQLQAEQEKEKLRNSFAKVLEATKAHIDSWPFVDPVQESYAPNYYSIIKAPMDIATMDLKVEEKMYPTVSDFVSDMDLIFQNCVQYNGRKSEYTMMARKVEACFRRALKKQFPTFRKKNANCKRVVKVIPSDSQEEEEEEEEEEGDEDEEEEEEEAEQEKEEGQEEQEEEEEELEEEMKEESDSQCSQEKDVETKKCRKDESEDSEDSEKVEESRSLSPCRSPASYHSEDYAEMKSQKEVIRDLRKWESEDKVESDADKKTDVDTLKGPSPPLGDDLVLSRDKEHKSVPNVLPLTEKETEAAEGRGEQFKSKVIPAETMEEPNIVKPYMNDRAIPSYLQTPASRFIENQDKPRAHVPPMVGTPLRQSGFNPPNQSKPVQSTDHASERGNLHNVKDVPAKEDVSLPSSNQPKLASEIGQVTIQTVVRQPNPDIATEKLAYPKDPLFHKDPMPQKGGVLRGIAQGPERIDAQSNVEGQSAGKANSSAFTGMIDLNMRRPPPLQSQWYPPQTEQSNKSSSATHAVPPLTAPPPQMMHEVHMPRQETQGSSTQMPVARNTSEQRLHENIPLATSHDQHHSVVGGHSAPYPTHQGVGSSSPWTVPSRGVAHSPTKLWRPLAVDSPSSGPPGAQLASSSAGHKTQTPPQYPVSTQSSSHTNTPHSQSSHQQVAPMSETLQRLASQGSPSAHHGSSTTATELLRSMASPSRGLPDTARPSQDTPSMPSSQSKQQPEGVPRPASALGANSSFRLPSHSPLPNAVPSGYAGYSGMSSRHVATPGLPPHLSCPTSTAMESGIPSYSGQVLANRKDMPAYDHMRTGHSSAFPSTASPKPDLFSPASRLASGSNIQSLQSLQPHHPAAAAFNQSQASLYASQLHHIPASQSLPSSYPGFSNPSHLRSLLQGRQSGVPEHVARMGQSEMSMLQRSAFLDQSAYSSAMAPGMDPRYSTSMYPQQYNAAMAQQPMGSNMSYQMGSSSPYFPGQAPPPQGYHSLNPSHVPSYRR